MNDTCMEELGEEDVKGNARIIKKCSSVYGLRDDHISATESLKLEPLLHPFYDELRDPSAWLTKGRFLPPLLNFKPRVLTSICANCNL
ncbi:hypothetical protein C5167_012020 [Papaver somniferum]|uniref:Uncharacterized protein n=1 Tax=Papaver somniferum TaxID=3469 RepID=A0A4Y7J0I4_PAPSO|nr:hypothetical protein C5167_012020 [Papaver somniferum]